MVTPTSVTLFFTHPSLVLFDVLLSFFLVRSHFFLGLLPPLAQRAPPINLNLLFAELNFMQPAG